MKTRLILVLALIAAVEGFRLVTQAGTTGFAGSIQNDGYAVSGGILLLVAGVVLGILIARRWPYIPRFFAVRRATEQNIQELYSQANELHKKGTQK